MALNFFWSQSTLIKAWYDTQNFIFNWHTASAAFVYADLL